MNNNQTGNVRVKQSDVRFLKHCCSGKVTSITYPECVSVALVTQHA